MNQPELINMLNSRDSKMAFGRGPGNGPVEPPDGGSGGGSGGPESPGDSGGPEPRSPFAKFN